MNELPLLFGMDSWWPALSGFVAWLSAFVALDMLRHVHQGTRAHRVRWFVASGASLGTGVCSALVLGLAARPPAYPMGHHAGGAFLAWAAAAAIASLALALGGGKSSGRGVAAIGACGLALGIVLPQIGLLLSLGTRPGLNWQVGQLVLALGSAGLAAAVAVGLYSLWSPSKLGHAAIVQRGVTAALLVVAILASQAQVISAADLPSQAFSRYERNLSLGALSVLASFGSITLLLALLAASWMAGRRSESPSTEGARERTNALRDSLTGLPSRQLFEGTLAQAVKRADTNKGQLALLSVDLDGFKTINQNFGHAVGDQMLSELAKRLRALAPPHMVSRLAGDVFLMLLPAQTENDGAAQVAANVLASLAEPCKLAGAELTVSCSIGIVMYPQHGALSTLIAHAEAAMRASKSNGGSTYSFFEPRMLQGSREQNELLRDLRLALAKQQLELYYQPKIHAPSGEITGAEALMRWHHPQRGMVSPVVFIPIAERYGLIDALGNWVIDSACAQVRAWRDEGLRMRVAINLSVHQLRDPKLPDRIDAALKRHQINPELLTCEITESVAMEDAERTIQLFAKLAAVGVSISIDDFGTGYSSLSYLRKLPATELKIDRSFVFDLETSADARAVVDAVIKLAQALGLKVVAEGVETEAQNQILRTLGCDELQGYLFAKPMSAKALALWAMNDEGPRSMMFRASLFRPTIPAEAA